MECAVYDRVRIVLGPTDHIFDFVVEIRSPSDRLSVLQEKMQEYLDNGAGLGWLIDPMDKKVYIYRSGQAVVALDDPETLSGDPELPGFILNVRELW